MPAKHEYQYAGWAEAFSIFAKYSDSFGHVSAEHDEIWAGPEPEIVSGEDRQRLEELGWTAAPENCFHKFT